MPRKPRGVIVHSFVHITAKGNREAPIYDHELDYEFFLRGLREFAQQDGIRIHAYCLMTNHFHLLTEAREQPISRFMHRLQFRYAQYFNRRYGYSGHLFCDRYWAGVCPDDAYMLAALRYIHLNPVRAGLVQTPDAYRWSSHRVYLGVSAVPWVVTDTLDFFGADRQRAVEAYARFVRLEGKDAERSSRRIPQ